LPQNECLRIFQQRWQRPDRQIACLDILLQRLQLIELRRVRPLKPEMLRIGTRGSALALWQAEWVKDALIQANPDLRVALSIIKTKGDKILDVPLAQVGGKGLFVKEIEDRLLDGAIDVAVHSMKDMPSRIPPGLCIGAIPAREAPFDVLVSNTAVSLMDIPSNGRIGTSSLRRSAQLKHLRPDIDVVSLRGNLDTRIRKLTTENLDGILVAAAGMIRLGMADRITERLDPVRFLPAVGQGALAIEIREDDPQTRAYVDPLNDPASQICVLAERAFLDRLEGGCQVPLAGHARIVADQVHMDGLVASLDGNTLIRRSVSGPPEQAEAMGVQLAEILLANGADVILKELKAYADSQQR
jgi:hydroxymethylbilane synthase